MKQPKYKVGETIYLRRLGHLVAAVITAVGKAGRSTDHPGEPQYTVKIDNDTDWVVESALGHRA